MRRSDQPQLLIGFLFALSIAFWGQEITQFYHYGSCDPGKTRICPEVWVFNRPSALQDRSARLEIEGILEGVRAIQGVDVLKQRELPNVAGTLLSSKAYRGVQELENKKSAKGKQEEYPKSPGTEDSHEEHGQLTGLRLVVWVLTLAAGTIFVADVACVVWWYSRYIYKVQSVATLWTYFLDFAVAIALTGASRNWTDPFVFLLTTLIACGFLFSRFIILRNSDDANDTDRRILRSAGSTLLSGGIGTCAALFVVFLVGNSYIRKLDSAAGAEQWLSLFYPVVIVAISLVGIGLTYRLRGKLQASIDIHQGGSGRFRRMALEWPQELKIDNNARATIIGAVNDGLDEFNGMFQRQYPDLAHERLRSRVHSEADLQVQSSILAMSSWMPRSTPQIKATEIKNKALMVGVSHWLDDLVDGRDEAATHRRLQKCGSKGLDPNSARSAFEQIFRDVAVAHTDKTFFAKLLDSIDKASPLPENQKFLYFSLNRIALGSVMFGPRVRLREREKLLQDHNDALITAIEHEASAASPAARWYHDALNLIREMQSDPRRTGQRLLGLTTKTVQEMAMASEDQKLPFALATLYSLLYVPLLYFHDVDKEIDANEMIALDGFDVGYVDIFPWLERIRGLIDRDDAPADDRRKSRLEQAAMAFRCFAAALPESVGSQLAAVYGSKPSAPAQPNLVAVPSPVPA